MSQPPTPAQLQHTVVVKSGCGKAALILGIIATICCLLVGGCFVIGAMGLGKAVHEVQVEQKAVKEATVDQLEIVDFSWNKTGGGAFMEASFKIHNKGQADLKDFVIECTHYTPSNTKIDSNTRTIYEIVKAGQTREFSKIDMGFIHSQAAHSEARIIGASTVLPTSPNP